jgi:hypothetical protein
MKTIMLAALAAVLTSAAALADTPRINNREDRQVNRIFNGVDSNQLSSREAAKLLKGQLQVRKLEDQFKSNGNVSNFERGVLNDALDRQSNRIYNKKHN